MDSDNLSIDLTQILTAIFLTQNRFSVKKLIIYILLLAIGIFGAMFITPKIFKYEKEDRILGVIVQQDSVNVSVTINTCLLTLIVYPENRIPVTGNWQTDVEAEVYTTSNVYVDTLSGTTDATGTVTFDLCGAAIAIDPGNYNFYIKGKSHLRKLYGPENTFTNIETTLDLTADGKLLSGETSEVFDNYINSLDTATQFANYNTADDKNDLNQDGIVNVFDISHTISRLYTDGECSPQDQLNNICRY